MASKVQSHSLYSAVFILLLACVIMLRVGPVRATGAPSNDPLWYSGVLEDNGNPVDGPRDITIRVWSSATSQATEDLECSTIRANTAIAKGRFRVALDATCRPAVEANPELWAEVVVGQISLGRSKVGASPYAIEAGRASSASGALEARIAGLETLSAFLARTTMAQSIPGQTQPVIIFDAEVFDSRGEYNPATATFAPVRAGLYDIACNIIFGGPGNQNIYFEAGIFVNGARTDVAAGFGDGYVQTFRARSLVPLAPGDAVTCRAYQNSTAAIPLIGPRPGEVVSSFSAVRLSAIR
ncbi:MAG: hypothetical protein SFY95_01125 [Planctomycetota bacterium]|nr:hypothetical protein [Planctomycetota bacterium]